MMRTATAIRLLSAVFAVSLFTGCYTGDPYDHDHHHGDYDRDHDHDRDMDERSERGDHRAWEVRGTVTRVDDDGHTITLDTRDRGREMVLSYDDETTLDFQGQTSRPGRLEPGDRISAMVERTDEGLMVEAIHVLSDARGDWNDRSGRDDRYDRGREDRGDRYDRDDRDGRSATDLQGVVRSTDAPNRILEVERAGSHGSGDMVEVHYDDNTVVEYQGHGYAAERLDRGDVVRIEVRGSGGPRVLADRIVVVAEAGSAGH